MNLKQVPSTDKIKTHTHIGVYGLFIKEGQILLINKEGGPYDGQLDLPGGSFEFGETPIETLKRELEEEVGIIPKKYELLDADSVLADWYYKETNIKVHHVGIFYKILEYEGSIKEKIEIDNTNDDSKGAAFYTIKDLQKGELSLITILELQKLGYTIK